MDSCRQLPVSIVFIKTSKADSSLTISVLPQSSRKHSHIIQKATDKKPQSLRKRQYQSCLRNTRLLKECITISTIRNTFQAHQENEPKQYQQLPILSWGLMMAKSGI